MATRKLSFPEDTFLGFVHAREGESPLKFHGRYTKEGEGPETPDENEGWTLIGEARGDVTVPDGQNTLLEILAEPARDLSPLSSLTPDAIDAIWLGNTWADDQQLVYLNRMTGLQWLDIQNNGQITDQGVRELRALQSLEWLGLHWTRISDDSLDVFLDLPQLKYLDIWGCNISPEALAEFQKARPRCKIRT